jgi:tRNA-specific 2-thiouridylase
MNKAAVRVEAERLGLRTWNKPDSQDVCFIEASKGREVFLRQRIALTSATIVDTRSGDVLGATHAAELMTVGQRRGITPGRDGEKRYVSRVDIAAGRVEVGTLDDIMISTIRLDASSLSFTDETLYDGNVVMAQWSAHGTPREATLRLDGDLRLELREPARPVASGQSVVMYRRDDPSIVEGAGIVLQS